MGHLLLCISLKLLIDTWRAGSSPQLCLRLTGNPSLHHTAILILFRHLYRLDLSLHRQIWAGLRIQVLYLLKPLSTFLRISIHKILPLPSAGHIMTWVGRPTVLDIGGHQSAEIRVIPTTTVDTISLDLFLVAILAET